MVRWQIYLRPDQVEAIRRMAQGGGLTFSVAYRDLIDLGLGVIELLGEQPTNAGLVTLAAMKSKYGQGDDD